MIKVGQIYRHRYVDRKAVVIQKTLDGFNLLYSNGSVKTTNESHLETLWIFVAEYKTW